MPPASVSSQYTRTGKWKWAAGAPESGITRSVIGRRDDKAPARPPPGPRGVRSSKVRSWARAEVPPADRPAGPSSAARLLARLLVDRTPDGMAGFRVGQRERRIGRPRGAELGL